MRQISGGLPKLVPHVGMGGTVTRIDVDHEWTLRIGGEAVGTSDSYDIVDPNILISG